MNIRRSLLIIFTLYILGGCKNEELESLTNKLNISQAKLELAKSKGNQIPIVSLLQTDGRFFLTLEGDLKMEFDESLVSSVTFDSANWISTFTFNDGSTEEAYFIGKLNIPAAAIAVNPYLYSPLTAEVKIETPIPGKFKVIVHGKGEDGIPIEREFSKVKTAHQIPILGLYEGYQNLVELQFLSREGGLRNTKKIAIETNAIPNKPTLKFDILTSNDKVYNGLYFFSNIKVGLDQKGEIRWYYSGPGSSFIEKLKNGNFTTGNNPDIFHFYEVTMLGQVVKQFHVPDGFHHEIREMENGNFLIASHTNADPLLEDVMVELDRSTSKVVKLWDFNKILDPLRKGLPDVTAGDWLHVNGAYFDKTDNSIVISGRSQSAVVKIDYNTGAIKWILSHPAGWGDTWQPYLLKPTDINGIPLDTKDLDFWAYGQHNPLPLDGNKVLVYDNGDYRNFYDDNSKPQISYSRAVEYKIDESAKTVQLVWSYDYGKAAFTPYTGSVQTTSSDSRLIGFMWGSSNTPKIIEVNTKKEIIFEANLNVGLSSRYYRAFKVDLYSGIDL